MLKQLRQLTGLIGLALSLIPAIPFLIISVLGDIVLSPFYRGKRPFSGPPILFRMLAGGVAWTLIVFGVLMIVRNR